MSDIATLETEIRQMLETLHLDIESLNKKDPSQRAKQILRCQNKIIEIRTRIEAFELETLQLDKFSQIQHKDTLKTLQTEYKDLKGQFERKKAEKAPGDPRYAAEERIEKNLDEMNGQELVQVGHKTQQQGMDALKRVLGQIEGANEKADQINVELQRQDEVIVRSKEKAMDVQTEIKRAGQYLRYFARQVYTDKLMMCLIFLCVIAIVVIIIMKIVKKSSVSSVTDVIS